MNKTFLPLLLTLAITIPALAQNSVKIKDPVRVIEYYNLKTRKNNPFFRDNHELPAYLLKAVSNGSLQPYEVYGDMEPHPMSQEDWLARLTFIPAQESFSLSFGEYSDEVGQTEVVYYDPDQLYLISLDVTSGQKGKNTYRQINYLSLYVHPDENEDHAVIYLGSFKFDQVKAILRQHKVLYYTLTKGLVWRDSFIPNYWWDSDPAQEVYRQMYKDATPNQKESDLFIISSFNEDLLGSTWKTSSVDLFHERWDTANTHLATISGQRWATFFSERENEVFFMDDAITSGRLHPLSDTSLLKVLRPSGSLSDRRLLLPEDDKITINTPADLSKTSLAYQQWETISLTEEPNSLLQRPGQEISRILIDAISKERIEPYQNDSLTSTMSLTEVRSRLAYNGYDQSPDKEKPQASYPQKIHKLWLTYTTLYDQETNAKTYRFKSLALVIPSYESPEGIDYPLFYLNRDDVKNVLQKDSRATYQQDNQSATYWDFLDNRSFKRNFLISTSYMQLQKE